METFLVHNCSYYICYVRGAYINEKFKIPSPQFTVIVVVISPSYGHSHAFGQITH